MKILETWSVRSVRLLRGWNFFINNITNFNNITKYISKFSFVVEFVQLTVTCLQKYHIYLSFQKQPENHAETKLSSLAS